MNSPSRGVAGFILGMFGAGLIHSLLPPGNIWLRAAITGAAAALIGGLSAWLLSHSRRA